MLQTFKLAMFQDLQGEYHGANGNNQTMSFASHLYLRIARGESFTGYSAPIVLCNLSHRDPEIHKKEIAVVVTVMFDC
jgi:hypothetical protein